MTIPILNIYYMLLYAWDVLEEGETIPVGVGDTTRLVDLFARVLHTGTEAILRRGLDRGYVEHVEAVFGIKGKPLISASVKANLFRSGQVVCEFEQFSHDVLHNRILKATIRK